MPEWRHILGTVAAAGLAHQFAHQFAPLAGAQTTPDSIHPAITQLAVEPVAERVASLIHVTGHIAGDVTGRVTDGVTGATASAASADRAASSDRNAAHEAEADAEADAEIARIYLSPFRRTRPAAGPKGETDRPSRSALLKGLDDQPPAFDLSRGPDEERSADPLRPRQGGAFELIDSSAGDLSLGFGLVRAGETSAREKDRSVLESRQLSVRGASGPVQVLDAGLGWRLQPGRTVTVSFEGGLRALTRAGPDAHTDYAFTELGDEPITLPVVGAALEWDLLSGLRFESGATGHMDDRQGTFVDFFAEARIDLTNSTDFIAGYRFLDASFESDRSRAELSQDALYAGIRIRY